MNEAARQKILEIRERFTAEQMTQLKFIMAKAFEEGGKMTHQMLVDEFGDSEEQAKVVYYAFMDIIVLMDGDDLSEEEYNRRMAEWRKQEEFKDKVRSFFKKMIVWK